MAIDPSITRDLCIIQDPSVVIDLSIAIDPSIRSDVGCIVYMSRVGYPTTAIGMLVSRNRSIAEIKLGHHVVSWVDVGIIAP
jgi:hypothetical protein